MGKPGLTEADKMWIAGLIRPINNRLDNIEQDIKALKEDMVEVKTRLKAIEECPTIQKELKKDDE